jgi:transcriptional regulator with XRE-family HTH domain
MSALTEQLRQELRDREYREGYDEAFLDHHIATQIRAIREQRGWSQSELANAAGMKQSRISAMEGLDYGSWSVNSLRRVAYALGVRLRIDFAEWGDLLEDIERSGTADLQRRAFEDDPVFQKATQQTTSYVSVGVKTVMVVFDTIPELAKPRNPHKPQGSLSERRRQNVGLKTLSLLGGTSGGVYV